MNIDVLLNRLDKVKPCGDAKWKACCPAHEDRTPSLVLTELRDGRILLHCFAGCDPSEIMAAVGLRLSDLFPDGAINEFRSWKEFRKQKQEKDHERLILEMAEESRKRGERLSPQDLEREKEAWLRVHENADG